MILVYAELAAEAERGVEEDPNEGVIEAGGRIVDDRDGGAEEKGEGDGDGDGDGEVKGEGGVEVWVNDCKTTGVVEMVELEDCCG